MKAPSSAASGLGRPRSFDPERALAVAMRVFWARGYGGASLAELTSEMGIARTSLYLCFESKEDLFRKALELYRREKRGFMRQALEAPTARGVAEQILKGLLERQRDGDPRGCLDIATSIACSAVGESIRAEVIASRAAFDAALVARFVRASREGDIPAHIAPAALAGLLVALTQGLSIQASSGDVYGELQGLVDVALFLWPSK